MSPPRRTADVRHPVPPRYVSVTTIAHGGMGEVYLATDSELDREVAIKVLAERFADDEPIRLRFRREALTASRVSAHPNIVTIFDVAEHEGRPLIVMEYLAGGSLAARQEGKPHPTSQVLAWVEEAAAALDAAHSAGIVHRDVKPANLLLDGEDRVHVGDFGVASAAGLTSMTQTGTVLGTAGYLAPEQALGERATPASDIYGLAVVAWELLAGARPFARESVAAEAAAHVHEPVPSVHRANPALPPELDAVFRRALSKDPAGRQQSASELAAELGSAVHEAAGRTRILPTRPVGPGRRRLRRLPLVLPLAAAAALAAGAAAAVLATRGDGGTAARAPRTVVRTVTSPGATVTETAPAKTTQPPAAQSGNGLALNDRGFSLMRAGDYAAALPLLEQAVTSLAGSGRVEEGYADYNLAYTRLALGQCDGVGDLLERAKQVEGNRKEIDRLRKSADHSCR